MKEEKFIQHTLKRKECNWVGQTLRRNSLLQHVIESKIDGKGRRGKRSKQVLDDLKERRGYWKMKDESLDCTL